MTDERVAIFIDGANLYHCLRDEFGKHNVDMEKLPIKLCGQRKLIRFAARLGDDGCGWRWRGEPRAERVLRWWKSVIDRKET